jgi:MFS family permease
MAAPFRWLMKSLDVGRKNPKALFLGFFLMLLVGLVPGVMQIFGQAVFPPTSGALMAIYGLSFLLSMVLLPPLVGAAFNLLHACERGQPAAATDIFDGYRDLSFAIRMWLTMLLVMLMYVVALGLLFALLPGKEFFVELMMRAAATPPGGQPDMAGMPAFPPSFLLWLLGAMFVVLVLANVYMLAYARAALNQAGPVQALLDGFAGTLRNLLPFILVAIVVTIVGFVLLLLLALVAGVAIGLLMAISPVLAAVVGVPVYIGLMLMLYVVAFGYFYHAWQDIFGEPAVAPEDSIAA